MTDLPSKSMEWRRTMIKKLKSKRRELKKRQHLALKPAPTLAPKLTLKLTPQHAPQPSPQQQKELLPKQQTLTPHQIQLTDFAKLEKDAAEQPRAPQQLASASFFLVAR